MSAYSCLFAESIGHVYNLAPEQGTPAMLRQLASGWRPGERDLSPELPVLADDLAREPAASGLSEVERGWARRENRKP